jgi:formylglycine-generating enzyme required for sulfatase activity
MQGASNRVLRGGSFNSRAIYARSALRNRLTADDRYNFLGCRPARVCY